MESQRQPITSVGSHFRQVEHSSVVTCSFQRLENQDSAPILFAKPDDAASPVIVPSCTVMDPSHVVRLVQMRGGWKEDQYHSDLCLPQSHSIARDGLIITFEGQ